MLMLENIDRERWDKDGKDLRDKFKKYEDG